MKICFLTTSFPRNESDTYVPFVGRLAKNLAAKNIGVDVVTSSDSGSRDEVWGSGLRVHRFSYFFPGMQLLTYKPGGAPEQIKKKLLAKLQLPFFILAFILKSLKTAKSCDVIHAHWTLSGLVGLILKKLYRKPLIVTIREGDINSVVNNPLLVFVLKKADRVIINNDEYKNRIISAGVNPLKISKILNGVDAVFKPSPKIKARKELGLPGKKKLILFAGSLISRKNPEILVDCARELLEKYGAVLVMIGEGPMKAELENKMREHKDRLIFPGRVPSDRMPLWFNATDIFVLPTSADGIPNVVTEAMSCGTAVVCTDLESVHELIKDGENALLFRLNDKPRLTENLELLLRNSKLRERLAKNARKTIIRRKLTWENCARQHIEIYKQLV